MRRLVINMRDTRPIWAIPDWAVAEICDALPDDWEAAVVEAPVDSRGDGSGVSGEAVRTTRGAEVYFGAGVPPEILAAARSTLRWAHTMAAGVGGSLYAEMRTADVILTNSAGTHAPAVAESAIAMAFHFARGLDLAVRAQADRRWDKAPFDRADTPVSELGASTIGIIGFGGIGRAVARRALGLGMRVLASKRSPAEAPRGVELRTGEGALGAVLRESDFVVLCVPGTEETRGMIGPDEIAAMRDGAVLINVARGSVVDERALTDALRAGRLRGVGLDVFSREPLPSESPLWRLPNVLITPHVSSTTPCYWRREIDLLLDNIGRYLAGRELRNAVDKRAGY